MNFLSFFFLSLSTHLALQPRSGWPSNVFGGSVGGKASTICIEISPTPPLIFTGGVKKCKIWCRLKQDLTLSRTHLQMQQVIENLKQTSCVGMIPQMPLPSLVKLGPRTLENRWVKVSHPIKLHGKNVLNCR